VNKEERAQELKRTMEKILEQIKQDKVYAKKIVENADRLLEISKKVGLSLIGRAVTSWCSVAEMAINNQKIAALVIDTDILEGQTIAHMAACKSSVAANLAVGNIEIAKLRDKKGRTVAHTAIAWKSAAKIAANNPDVLKLADGKGWTVLHEISAKWPDIVVEKFIQDPEIAFLSDRYGNMPLCLVLGRYV